MATEVMVDISGILLVSVLLESLESLCCRCCCESCRFSGRIERDCSFGKGGERPDVRWKSIATTFTHNDNTAAVYSYEFTEEDDV